MNFYYHPILGLQYEPVKEIQKGDYNWDFANKGSVIWIPNAEGRFKILVESQKIYCN